MISKRKNLIIKAYQRLSALTGIHLDGVAEDGARPQAAVVAATFPVSDAQNDQSVVGRLDVLVPLGEDLKTARLGAAKVVPLDGALGGQGRLHVVAVQSAREVDRLAKGHLEVLRLNGARRVADARRGVGDVLEKPVR